MFQEKTLVCCCALGKAFCLRVFSSPFSQLVEMRNVFISCVNSLKTFYRMDLTRSLTSSCLQVKGKLCSRYDIAAIESLYSRRLFLSSHLVCQMYSSPPLHYSMEGPVDKNGFCYPAIPHKNISATDRMVLAVERERRIANGERPASPPHQPS